MRKRKRNNKTLSFIKVAFTIIALILMSGVGVMAVTTKVNNVTITLSNGYEMVVLTNKTNVSEILKDNNKLAKVYDGQSIDMLSKEDCEAFFKKAMNYGLLIYNDEYAESDTYFIPYKKLPNGSMRVDKFDYDGEYGVRYMISKPEYEDGWYVIHIGIDF